MKYSLDDKMMEKKKGVLIYVVQQFVTVTTTFITNEIWTLKKRGWDVTILSLEKNNIDVLHPRVKELVPDVICTERIFSRDTLKAHFYFLLNEPRKYIAIFFYVLLNRILPYHLSEFKLFLKAVYLAWIIRKKNIIHIHTHFAGGNTTCAKIISYLLDKNFSFIAHAVDLFYMEKPRTLREKIKKSKFVLTVSEYHKKYMINITNTKFPEKIIIYKSNVITDDFSAKTYKRGTTPLVLTVSRLTEKKGLFYLLEAYKILQDNGTGFEGIIIGDGSLEAKLREKIEEYSLGKNVKLISFVDQNAIKEYLLKADIFVLPCITASNGDRDGMPYSLVEAMACGLPVVSTYTSGIPELISNEKTGFLVPPRDSISLAGKLQLLLKDEELCRKTGLSAREYIIKHHNLAEKIEVIEGLIEN